MKFCTNCGLNVDGASFCSACGTANKQSNNISAPQASKAPSLSVSAPEGNASKKNSFFVIASVALGLVGLVFGVLIGIDANKPATSIATSTSKPASVEPSANPQRVRIKAACGEFNEIDFITDETVREDFPALATSVSGILRRNAGMGYPLTLYFQELQENLNEFYIFSGGGSEELATLSGAALLESLTAIDETCRLAGN